MAALPQLRGAEVPVPEGRPVLWNPHVSAASAVETDRRSPAEPLENPRAGERTVRKSLSPAAAGTDGIRNSGRFRHIQGPEQTAG